MNFKSSKFKILFVVAIAAVALAFTVHRVTMAGQDMPPSGIMADEGGLDAPDMAPEVDQGDVPEALENDAYIKTENGDIHRFSVELAVTGEEQEKGLMFRNSMPADHGMLFIFRTTQKRSFWMKNTLIPLDIIFLEADGRIQHIHHNAKPQDLSFITSGQPCKAVLELNGGTADRMGIEIGDTVHHTAFRNLNLLHH